MKWHYFVGIALILSGCAPEVAPVPPSASPTYRIASMRWLPPGEDIVYAYKTEDIVAKSSGVMMLRLQHPAGDSIELVTPQRSETLRYQDNGILRDRTGTLLLKVPPKLGDRWPAGPGVSAKVVRDNAQITVEAGSFDGCVEILEERHVPVSGTVTTTFCPNVGIVRMETYSEEPLIRERVELRSFGKAFDLSAPP